MRSVSLSHLPSVVNNYNAKVADQPHPRGPISSHGLFTQLNSASAIRSASIIPTVYPPAPPAPSRRTRPHRVVPGEVGLGLAKNLRYEPHLDRQSQRQGEKNCRSSRASAFTTSSTSPISIFPATSSAEFDRRRRLAKRNQLRRTPTPPRRSRHWRIRSRRPAHHRIWDEADFLAERRTRRQFCESLPRAIHPDVRQRRTQGQRPLCSKPSPEHSGRVANKSAELPAQRDLYKGP